MNSNENNNEEMIYNENTVDAENTAAADNSAQDSALPLSKQEIKRKERAVKKANRNGANEPFNLKKEIFEWVYTLGVALLVVAVVKGFIFDVVKVDGSSMCPTLYDRDKLIVTKLGYKPEQGDIVILDSTYKAREEYKDEYEQVKGSKMNLADEISFRLSLPKRLEKKYYVKRIIALPGQTVDIKNGSVYVDGEKLDEEYTQGITKPLDTKMPVTVEDGCVFVMGDNREHSTDSRASSLGQVPFKAILGKSQLRILPIASFGITE